MTEQSFFRQLSSAGREIMQGHYKAAAEIFTLAGATDGDQGAAELAELFGLMTVKVEARELSLERALAEVQKKNIELERASALRSEFGSIFCGTVIVITTYAMGVAFLQRTLQLDMGPLSPATHLVNLAMFVALALQMTWVIRKHHYPLATFGLTWQNWKRSLVESLLAVIPILLWLVGVKWYLVGHTAAFAGQPLIEWTHWGPWQMFLVYVFVCIAQELSMRGFMQTCIERGLMGRWRTTLAVLLGAAEFGVCHIHYSVGLAALAFLGAAVFGLLFIRHRTIVGITVLHYIVGQCIFGPLQLVR